MENTSTIKRGKTYSIVITAMFAALTAVFSQISIPIGPVPINLALLSVFVAGGLLGIKRAVISQLVYVLIGAVGLPVFAGFKGGVGALTGPTGGYIIGYVLAAGAVALITAVWNKKLPALIVSMLAGLVICYAFGTAWFVISSGTNLLAALSSCVFPFLPGDALKIAAAAALCLRLKRVV